MMLLEGAIGHSASLSIMLLLKKAAVIFSVILTSLACGAQLPRDWRSEIALVSTPDQGSFAGIRIDSQVDGFFGIPFAQAPLGDLRFAKTKALTPYRKKDVRDASRPGAACPQPPEQVASDTSEDCLFLNIYRPHSSPKADAVPVMFYVHGGSWALGSGSMSFYNGTALVHRSLELKEPIMLVTINYRLGAFGFLGGEAMYEGDKAKTAALNAGLYDVREALRWVRQNIASFGGDPDKVTIWGESAGANAVAAQMLARSGKTEGLFARAIMQSGSQAVLPRYKSTDVVPSTMFEFFVQAVGCSEATSPLACLRQTEAAVLNKANSLAFTKGIFFSPLRDNFFVQESPSMQLHKGDFNHSVPFIHGINLDEGTQAAAAYAANLTLDSDFAAVVAHIYGPSVQHIIPDLLRLYPNIPSLGQPTRPYYWGSSPDDTFYPPGKDGSIHQYKRLSSFLHDILFEAGRRQHLYAASSVGLPAFAYRFAQPTPENSPLAKFQDTASLGVQHASDLPYVFGYIPTAANMSQQPVALRKYIADDIIKRTTAMMTAYWINFAAHGDPNGPGLPHWPRYIGVGEDTGSTGKELILQPEGIKMQSDNQHLEQTSFILKHAGDCNM